MTLTMTTLKSNKINGSEQKSSSSLKVSQDLQNLISNNSELGSRLLSLLLVSSGNGKEIIDAINNGDITKIQNLDIDLNLKVPDVHDDENNDSSEVATSSEFKGEFGNVKDNNNKDSEACDSEDNTAESQVDKRRRNTEASARFRIRKKLREQEKLNKIKELNVKINGLYKNIDRLVEENRHWKAKLEQVNERKSRELLERIKSGNAM